MSKAKSIQMRFVKYCRQASVVSLLLTVAGIMLLPDGFIWFVLAAYLAIIVWGCDVVLQEVRELGLLAQILATVPFVVALAWFSARFVWVRLPLDMLSRNLDADYPDGTVIGGIQWNQKYADLRVTLSNGTDYDYTDLNLLLKPKEPITDAAQVVTDLPGVSIVRESEKSFELKHLRPSTHQVWEVPTALFASTGGYRVTCDRLPAGEQIEIVLASVSINQPRIDHDAGYVGGPFPYAPKGHPKDVSEYWYRWTDRPLPDDVFEKRPRPRSVTISGQYVAFHRREYVSQTLSVSSVSPDVINQLIEGKRPRAEPSKSENPVAIMFAAVFFAVLVLLAPLAVFVLR